MWSFIKEFNSGINKCNELLAIVRVLIGGFVNTFLKLIRCTRQKSQIEVFLIGEVAVKCSFTDSGLGGNVLHSNFMKPLTTKKSSSRIEHFLGLLRCFDSHGIPSLNY